MPSRERPKRTLTEARVPYEIGHAQYKNLARAQITGQTARPEAIQRQAANCPLESPLKNKRTVAVSAMLAKRGRAHEQCQMGTSAGSCKIATQAKRTDLHFFRPSGGYLLSAKVNR